MGLPMAKNLVDAGYSVVAHNRSSEPTEELVEYGGRDGRSPAEVAEQSNVVLLCLPDSPDVKNIVLGTGNESEPLIDRLSEGMTVIDPSTISPTVTETLAEKVADTGVVLLDAPISDGEEGAIEGSLSIMVGGDENMLNKQKGLLEVIGERLRTADRVVLDNRRKHIIRSPLLHRWLE